MDAGVIVTSRDGVTHIRFDRPESRNSLTRSVCTALRAALSAADAEADATCRSVVLEGSGGSFASGADLAELDALIHKPDELIAQYRELRCTQEMLYELGKPTVASIDGFCFGAGLSLALACDLRIATSRSVFAAPPARLGLLYSDSEVRRLASRIGSARARDLLFTGRRVDAEEALRLGLIERLTDLQSLEAVVEETLAGIAECSPVSVRKTKQQLLRLERAGSLEPPDDAEAEAAFFQPDAAEGIAAFLERRRPRFS